MSFKGTIETECPSCEESMTSEVWSFIRGDADEPLRDALLAGELNLLLCEHCGKPFYPEAAVVYLDPGADLLAFIFPESYAGESARWERKMRSDWRQMRQALGGLARRIEPQCFFGLESFKGRLREDDELEDEIRVAQSICGGLGLELRHVDPMRARKNGLPPFVPVRRGAKGLTPSGVREGLASLLKANDSLPGFGRWAAYLEKGGRLPLMGSGKGRPR